MNYYKYNHKIKEMEKNRKKMKKKRHEKETDRHVKLKEKQT